VPPVAEGSARDEMIAAAERVAVERGLGAMSLREVQLVSGQRNKSAAQYHFGSREGLIEAVVASRMGPVNERRLALLAELDAAGLPPSIADLTTALVVPLAERAATPGSRWARFLSQAMADPVLAAVVRRSFEGLSYLDVRARLVAALDHLPADRRARRVDHATGLMVLSLAAIEAQVEATGATHVPVPELVDDLVAMCAAVLAAPASTGVTLLASTATTPSPTSGTPTTRQE
jgi:AcrR family transcriptional regulator